MPIIPIGPFSTGLQGDFGFSGARGIRIQELRNFYVNRQGFVQRRGGSSHFNSTENSAMIKELYVAPFTYEAATGVPITVPRVLGIEYSTAALQLITSSGAYTEIQRGLSSGNVSLRVFNFDQATPPFQMFNGRLFIGIYSSNTRGFVWADNTSIAASECYSVGQTAPAAGPSVSASVGGDLTASTWYSFRYTYYNSTHSIETIASAVGAVVTTGANRTADVVCTQITNKGFNQFRIYRNQTGQTTQALAEAADHYLVGAQAMTNGTSTQSFAVTATTLAGGAYTLDTDTSYLDVANHDVLTGIPIAMEPFNDRLWVAVEPRTLAWSKKTTEGIFPDWYPTKQSVTVGTSWDRITQVMASPSTEILLVFTRNALFSVTLDGPTGVEVNQFASVGAPYPRTIVPVGDWIYFVGTDNQVWRTNGAILQIVSRQANHLISHFKPSWHMFPCAARWKDKYQLSFSSGTAVFTTTNNATTIHTNQVVSSSISTTGRLTPSSGAWDLSSVQVGMFVEHTTSPELYYGYVCAVDDANNRIDVDAIPQALGTGQYQVLTHDRVLVFDTTYDYWYEVRGWNHGALNWDQAATDDFFAATADGAYVDLIHTTDTTDADGAGTAAITSFLKTEPISGAMMKAPTSRIRPLAIYAFPSGTATALTVNLYKDYSTSSDTSPPSWTPAQSENWRIGVSPSGYARAWEVEIQGSAAATQAGIDVEFEVMP